LKVERNQKFFDVFGREFREEKRERISLGNAPKLLNFVFFDLRGVCGSL